MAWTGTLRLKFIRVAPDLVYNERIPNLRRSRRASERIASMMRRLLVGCAAFCLLGLSSRQADVAAAIDAIVEAPVKAGRVAGASVAVVKGSETVLSKGYGFADLELDVPTPLRATYEIGSITKQFTAAAILLLAEQGKLSLDDEITKFLPDYPTQGNHISIRRLLDHTSGINQGESS
jgi:CubicO group peptidase (beta-lactamase class C family)